VRRSATFLVCALLLCACAATPSAAPTPALGPAQPAPAATAAPPPAELAPAPTAETAGANLPGRLLFVQSGNLWLWQGDAGRQITSTGDAFQPAWSPDGSRIAYVQRTTSASDLMVLPPEGGVPTRLTENAPDGSVYSYDRIYTSRWAFYPAWAPSGDTLVFASQFGPPGGSPAAEYRLSLFTLELGARQPLQRYGASDGHVGRSAYLPDGSAIVFAFEPLGEAPPTLYRYQTELDDAQPLAGAPPQSYDPAVSADGRWLAFAMRDGAGTDIYAMPLAGGAPVRLTSLATARAPAFAPDGAHLAFLALSPGSISFDVWVVDLQASASGTLSAGQPRQITRDMGLDADSGIAWGR
jgi:TolB protein